VVVTRAPAEGYVSGESRGDAELIWLPAEGGEATLIAPAEGRGNIHFRTGEPDRIYAYGGGAVVSFRWDGLEEREHVRVAGASLVTLAPQGDQALAQVGGHVHAVTVPPMILPDGQAPSVDPDGDNFPGDQLTVIGGSFPAWDQSGRRIHWSIGNAHVIYDLDAAEAFADSLEAAEADAPSDTTTAGEETESEDDPEYEPLETRIEIVVERDIPQGQVVLRGARIITMNDDLDVIENGEVVIRNNRIVYVGPSGSGQIEGQARIIDMAGMTITPGFVDTHAHLRARGVHRAQNWSYVANLAYGVTTTRDPQTGTTDVLDYTDMVEAGQVLGPRIYSTGPGVFSGENIQDLDHAREVLSRYSEYYDTKTIKQYVAGNREQRQWIIQAAYEQELMPTTEGSLDQEMGLSEIIDGYSGHEHSWPGFPIQTDFIRLAAESGIAYTPTILVAYGAPWAENFWYATERPHEEEKLRRFTPHSEVDGKTLRRADGWFMEEEHGFRLIGETVKDLVEAGGKAGIGSHGQLQGLGYHWELWSVASGGMQTMDALRVATRLGAEALGLDGDLGSVQEGMLADLVVLSANPLDDLRNSKAIRFVMKNGRLYDGDTLAEIYPTEGDAPTFYWQRDEPNTAAGIGG
jgi:hypothetical protein